MLLSISAPPASTVDQTLATVCECAAPSLLPCFAIPTYFESSEICSLLVYHTLAHLLILFNASAFLCRSSGDRSGIGTTRDGVFLLFQEIF